VELRLKVIEETPRYLRLAFRPLGRAIGISLAIALFLFFAIGSWPTAQAISLGMLLIAGMWVLALVVFVRFEDVVFDREAQRVLIRGRSLLGLKRQVVELGKVRAAELDTSTSFGVRGETRRTAPVHCPVLRLRSGEKLPLSAFYRRGESNQQAVDTINRWLRR
jgi:predicted signal transduction protein with EAL and GGDEF domain